MLQHIFRNFDKSFGMSEKQIFSQFMTTAHYMDYISTVWYCFLERNKDFHQCGVLGLCVVLGQYIYVPVRLNHPVCYKKQKIQPN